jgi:tetratricopeptide (TPR) repeat protein
MKKSSISFRETINFLKTIVLLAFTAFNTTIFSQVMPDKFVEFQYKLYEVPMKEKFKLLKKAIKENPNEPWYYWMLANTYEFESDTKNVVKYYEKSIELDSKFAAGHANLARYLTGNDSTQLDKALMHINKAIALEPKTDHFHIDRANIYLKKKEYDLAIKNANMELNLPDPDPYPAYEVIVSALYAQKKQTELTSFLKKIDASKGIYGTEFTFFLGSLYENIKDFKKACLCYHTAAESYVIMKEKIPSNIELKLKNCKK